MEAMCSSKMLFPDSDPVLDARSESLLWKLCTVLPLAESKDLSTQVEEHLKQIHSYQRHNEFIDVELANRIAKQLYRLLEQYATYDIEQQRLIVGAARYFVDVNDEESDIHSIFGMEDDVRILNYVLGQIGEPEHRIEP